MPAHAKLTARQAVDFRNTPVELEHPGAPVTEKMMMVSLPRTLVNRQKSWNFKGRKPALLQQLLNVPVNRGDAQPLFAFLRRLENLHGRKRTVRALESRSDG